MQLPGIPDSEQETIRHRLEILELAERLGNVSEACRLSGISRTQFYVYRKRYRENGLEGLRDRPSVHHSHPQTTPLDVEARILELSLGHPAWGCDRLSQHLDDEGRSVSAQTVQNILNRNDVGTRHDRWLKLEEEQIKPGFEPTLEQIKFLEKVNPAYRERHTEVGRPGELLSQYVFSVGKLIDVGRIYLHAVVDRFSFYAFGYLHYSKRPEAAVAILREQVLPFFQEREILVTAILTNNGREFCGSESHSFERFLAESGIEHLRSEKRQRHTSGFLQRFRAIVLSEFFGERFRVRFYRNLGELQSDLNDWLTYYNGERPHQGYPNMGRSPLKSINEYLRQREELSASDGENSHLNDEPAGASTC